MAGRILQRDLPALRPSYSASHFQSFANAFEWMLRSCLLWSSIKHYLDDFIRIVPKKHAEPIPQSFHDFIQLTDAPGIPLNDSKDCCGTVVEVLGIEIDSSSFDARLSAQRLHQARVKTATTLHEDSLSLKDAQKLAGYLSYCSKVVRLGRAFLSSA